MSSQYANDFNRVTQTYYNELKKTKPMSKAREKRLLIQSKHGNIKARNEILEANLKFVFDIAKRYTGRGVAISDLISEGNMGLIYAINKFDENQDVKFISYAVWWIRHAIIEAIKKKKSMMMVEGNDNPHEKEFENNIPDSEDEHVTFGETEFSNSNDEKIREIQMNQSNVINTVMKGLNERETLIVNHFYGINGYEKLNLIEIGEKLEITSERVRQIKIQSMRKMRTNALLLGDYGEIFA